MDRELLEQLATEVSALSERVERLRKILSDALGRELPAGEAAGVGSLGQVRKPTAGFAGGIVSVLNLSGDIKKVQLALLRGGQSTVDDLTRNTGLDQSEISTYLRTLERQGSVVATVGKDGQKRYRPVMKKKRRTGSGALLDKLG